MGCCGSRGEDPDEKYNESIKFELTTPRKTRRPRDVLFLLVFIGMLGGMGFLAYTTWQLGDPARYIHGEDSWGNVCGRKVNRELEGVEHSGKDMSNNTFEFRMALSDVRNAMDPTKLLTGGVLAPTICVSECPAELTYCGQLLTDNGYNLEADVVSDQVCTMAYGVILPHMAVLNRCIPSQLVQMGTALADIAVQIAAPEIANQDFADMTDEVSDNPLGNSPLDIGDTQVPDSIGGLPMSPGGIYDFTQNVVDSIMKYWKDIIYLILFSCVIVLVIILLLQLFTRVLVVVIIIVAGFGSVAVTSFFWYNYLVAQGHINKTVVMGAIDSAVPAVGGAINTISGAVSGGNSSIGSNLNINISNLLQPLSMDSLRDSNYLLPIAIVSLVITLIILILLVWLRKSLCLVISLFDEASLAVFSMPVMLVQPFFTLVAFTVVICYFSYVGLLIATTKNVTVVGGMVVYQDYDNLPFWWLIAAHTFGCIWMIEFASACQQVILAGAISGWFFEKGETKKKCNLKLCPTLKPTKDLILYNLGSVALGSLIVTIIQFIRIVVTYIQSWFKGKENKYIKYLLICIQCYLAFLEKIVRYINRNAYICIAMYGDGFCGGAKNAFTLLLQNAHHMLALNCVSAFCLFLAKIAAAALTGLVGMLWFTLYLGVASATDYIVPVVVACVASFIVASCFLGVYGMAIDTIFLCFCDDQQRNNGADRPYFSTMRLQKYMSTKSGERNTPSGSSGPNNKPTIHKFKYRARVALAREVKPQSSTCNTVPIEFLLHPNIPSSSIETQRPHLAGSIRRKNLSHGFHEV